MSTATATSGSRDCILLFDAHNRLAVRRGSKLGLAFAGAGLQSALAQLDAAFPVHTAPKKSSPAAGSPALRIHVSQAGGPPQDPAIVFWSLDELELRPGELEAELAAALAELEPQLVEIPYLHLSEADFIYKFRPEKARNFSIYGQDAAAGALYQSELFAAIKALARRQERMAAAPVALDFGAVQYLIPSHFGFCLGVKNAIERAYETLAENPGRRVFMLSELIHNSFVNDDLRRRGLRYLQSDKGIAYTVEDRPATEAPGQALWWDTLTPEDVVIIPAFGATDEDKRRLVRRGIAVYPNDATCMLVEKVWKAARAYGREGYTVVIHGKYEHEETKATFSNTRRHAKAVIVRNLEEARQLGAMIASPDPRVKDRFYELFAGKYTPGFDVGQDLERIAIVNQTTLLMNETREIISYFREAYAAKYGADAPGRPARVGGSGRNDTLCYATQVNQDALARALAEPLDAAFVVGGKNSSNTYQLYRLCAQTLGERAFFIQGEDSIRPPGSVEHYVFPGKGQPAGHTEARPFNPGAQTGRPRKILITGGASCPDGIIQQVIDRINSFFPAGALRSPAEVLAELGAAAEKAAD